MCNHAHGVDVLEVHPGKTSESEHTAHQQRGGRRKRPAPKQSETTAEEDCIPKGDFELYLKDRIQERESNEVKWMEKPCLPLTMHVEAAEAIWLPERKNPALHLLADKRTKWNMKRAKVAVYITFSNENRPARKSDEKTTGSSDNPQHAGLYLTLLHY